MGHICRVLGLTGPEWCRVSTLGTQSLCALESTEETDLMKCVGSTWPSFTVRHTGVVHVLFTLLWIGVLMEDLWARLCISRLCENLTVLQVSSSLGTCEEDASVTSTVSLPHHLSLYPTGVHRGGRLEPTPQLEPRLLFFNNTSNI